MYNAHVYAFLRTSDDSLQAGEQLSALALQASLLFRSIKLGIFCFREPSDSGTRVLGNYSGPGQRLRAAKLHGVSLAYNPSFGEVKH